MFLKAWRKKKYRTNLNWIFKKIWNFHLKGALRNLRRYLQLFLDNIEPRPKNKNSILEKTVMKFCGLWLSEKWLNMSIILVSLSLRNIYIYIYIFLVWYCLETFASQIAYRKNLPLEVQILKIIFFNLISWTI